MAKEITSSVETLEAEAQKILEEAKATASEITLQAKEEAKKILSSPLPLDDIERECNKIVDKAREDAEKRIKDSQHKAMQVIVTADSKVRGVIERVVNMVRGQSPT